MAVHLFLKAVCQVVQKEKNEIPIESLKMEQSTLTLTLHNYNLEWGRKERKRKIQTWKTQT